ncbi:MAG: class I mannose-6-phosphate isomerase [Phycisphaerales bacterium]|nr:class I mannose-6-phosphate isomerase [Phycisphaerales bacterium]
MEPYPLLFEPILKPKVWGGRSLAALGKKLPPKIPIGESWEIADLPRSVADGQSVIANGEWEGQTLRQAMASHHEEIMGDADTSAEGGFPLLIKYLDAGENLSVQVHPDAEYAARHPEAHVKSEAWVVISAEPGSVIYKGVKPDVTAEEFAEHIRTDQVVDDLIAVPVKAGDWHYLPSGTCHALGAGIVVAEIQTPSDTTFRVYDWGRKEAPGTVASRELHIEQALECIDFGRQTQEKPSKPARSIEASGVRTTELVTTEFFHIERVDALSMARFRVVTSGRPEVWMMISGAGRIQAQNGPAIDLHPGTTALIPAGLGDEWMAMLARSAWMLRVKLPSPLKGMIA